MPAQFNVKLMCAESNGGKYRVSENECQGDRSSLGEARLGKASFLLRPEGRVGIDKGEEQGIIPSRGEARAKGTSEHSTLRAVQ